MGSSANYSMLIGESHITEVELQVDTTDHSIHLPQGLTSDPRGIPEGLRHSREQILEEFDSVVIPGHRS